LQDVATWKLEGYTNDEIAARLGCVTSTVERKLARIRTMWAREMKN
jgi:DNA-directed RNA polymerase specialized sigma24 family protein